jgi:hypothetical protein
MFPTFPPNLPTTTIAATDGSQVPVTDLSQAAPSPVAPPGRALPPAPVHRPWRQQQLLLQQKPLQPSEAVLPCPRPDDVKPVAIGGEILPLLLNRSDEDSNPHVILGNGDKLPLVRQEQSGYYVPAETAPAGKGKGKRVADPAQWQAASQKLARQEIDLLLQAAAVSVPSWRAVESVIQQAEQSGRRMSAAEIIQAHRDALLARIKQRLLQQAFNKLWGQQLLELAPAQAATGSHWELIKGVPAGDGAPMECVTLPAWALQGAMEALLQTSHVLLYERDPAQPDDQGRYVGVQRQPDGTHVKIDSLNAEPQPVNARALYDGLAREAGNLICAVPGGTERPKVLLRYHDWLSREGHEHVGQAMADVLGAKQLPHVVARLLTQEEARQQAVWNLPGREPLPSLPLVEVLKADFESLGNPAQITKVESSTMDLMQQIETGLESSRLTTGSSKALLCMPTTPLLIPVYRDQQGQWQARVPDEEGPGMTTRLLNDVMQQTQQGRRTEAEKTLTEAAEQRFLVHILTPERWPENWPPTHRVAERLRGKLQVDYYDLAAKRTTPLKAITSTGKSEAAIEQLKRGLEAYAREFMDKYKGGAPIEKAKNAAEKHVEKIGISLSKRGPAAHTSDIHGVSWDSGGGKGHWLFRVTDPKTEKQKTLYSGFPRGDSQAAIDLARLDVERYALKFKAERLKGLSIEDAEKVMETYLQKLQAPPRRVKRKRS